ncbi:PfkB domain protein [Magnetococcus marinus MC-1]|uniref:PfkB domain protein n=1 Tax=Magnetococcus marinus (strain ATCC BAA-1437 / JCM 17883 / MC-1) TaxID=156889 RepID=A0LCT1_MAGMM|nr:adenosine kinase [Magnetococcus marinus]ABK45774.1 PfkB domain protein [Magnetococcus marinus MC-1]
MAKIDVFGIGNALVDQVYAVEESFLTQIGEEKGRMSLVDPQRQAELSRALASTPALRACGGSAANSLIALTQLGGSAFHACRVAEDETGHFFAQDLTANGVQHQLHTLPAGSSGSCMVFITPDAERTMCTFLGASADLQPEDVPDAILTTAQWCYVEGYLVTAPNTLAAALKGLQQARANGVKTALSFSDVNMVKFFRDGFSQMLGESGVDLIFCNAEEALAFAETDDMAQATAALKKQSRTFVITLGAEGALLWDGQQEIQVAGQPAKAIDTNGAGDMFAGAFFYGITQGWDFTKAAQLACRCCAVLVTHAGARLPKSRTQEILAQFVP